VKWKTDRVAGLEISVKGGTWAERQSFKVSEFQGFKERIP
jgi:hypothetical protein